MLGAAAISIVAQTPAAAQTHLPAPGRTVYKCTIKGKLEYSDEPCIGAQRLNIVPTRGMNRLSGTARVGKDVQREMFSEQLGQAVRPLSGMNDAEYATFARRHQLSGAAQRECRQLEPAILALERAEQGAPGNAAPALLQELLVLRKRYKMLRC